MKLYEAIQKLLEEFGKEILTNTKAVNVFNDYRAFEESRAFRVIMKNLIEEGYMDQIMYIKDWSSSERSLIYNFSTATSFNIDNVAYVVKSIGYALGYTNIVPLFTQNSEPNVQPANTQVSNTETARNRINLEKKYSGISLDLTQSKYMDLDEDKQFEYKEAAEAYLENIIEFKTDFEKELGVKINTFVEYSREGSIIPKFEIKGEIKVEYDYSIMFCLLLYDQNNRLKSKDEIYVGSNRSAYEVVDTIISSSVFSRVSNVKRIVVYWQVN